jgi:hypothetical protein
MEDPRLAYLGPATVFQDGSRADVHALLFAEGEPPSSSFFGSYEVFSSDGEALRSGPARIHFSDASRADAIVAIADEACGGFRIRGQLESADSRNR